MATTWTRVAPDPPVIISGNGSDLRQVEDQVIAAFKAISGPLADYVLIEGVSLAASSTTLVQHKLGRAYRGWFLARRLVTSSPFEDTASTADHALYLPLALLTPTGVFSLVVF